MSNKKATPGRIALQAIKNLFEKPATISYAGKGAPQVEKNYRGRIVYDRTNCINCSMCMRDCPTGAIKVVNEGTKEDKKMRAFLDVGLCIFCCQCVDSCPKNCLSNSPSVDLASLEKKDLSIEL